MDGSYTVTATVEASSVTFALTNTGTPFAKLLVNTAGDALAPGLGLLSLREAVDFNNTSPSGNLPITFDGSKGGAFSVPRTILLGGSPLDLSNTSGTAAITAPAAGLTVSGGGLSGDFRIEPNVTASLKGLTITGGKASVDGGGVLNYGTVTLTKCTISGNTAANDGGGVAGDSGATSPGQLHGHGQTRRRGAAACPSGAARARCSTARSATTPPVPAPAACSSVPAPRPW